MSKSKTIVLIHGNFVNDKTWADWKKYYEQKGYTVYAPANPGHDGNPADLRAKVHPDLTKTGFIDIVNNITKLIDTLPEKPLVVGHSMAGMATLKLVELGKAAAGVSIDGAPPKNVFPPFQTLKTVIPAFGFFSSAKYFMGSRKWYDYAFFNTIPEAQKSIAFEKFAVPESYKVSRELVLNSFSNIDFKKPHEPILFVGGGSDHIFPPSLTETIASRYKENAGRVDLKIFDGKSHFICGEPGWETVADYILDWYEKL
ncbi:alpha/beta hydrolase [Flavobacterium nitrogenifigens]|uniref:Pimeloyl-ACP methyl ester carboxylesterase n=1 Tax=Flavobacterium nitrogenifigens TaxID=1617283 RepID=A0A521BH33_9FLAO|nr:alpha/beta hydrolase [Flavobacterium nitrogenifigens]KAF2339010.1 alpha/beta hydrolase [Flavobacterium nitrogenifigens]SMO46241.1 Pimeloyl-ACP methyl ester carboxylesterase [Flavobacterium nitrogenifigens]